MANKLDSTLKNMVLSLVLICGTMSAALGIVYTLTKKPIELAEKKNVNDAIKKVVSEFDNDPTTEVYKSDGLEFFLARKSGKLVGIAVKSFSDKGYAGNISVMVGFTPEGNIINTAVMEQKETPGLGTKMKEPKFKDQFNGKDPGSYNLKVRKDGGDVDAITAATISSRAFCDALSKAHSAYIKNKDLLVNKDTVVPSKGGIK
jgi:electron transport complex protein RnfG